MQVLKTPHEVFITHFKSSCLFQDIQLGLQMLLKMYIPTLQQIRTLLFYCFKYFYPQWKE